MVCPMNDIIISLTYKHWFPRHNIHRLTATHVQSAVLILSANNTLRGIIYSIILPMNVHDTMNIFTRLNVMSARNAISH